MTSGRGRSDAWNAVAPKTDVNSEPFVPRWVAAGRAILNWFEPGGWGPRAWMRRAIRKYLEWNRNLLLDPWLRYFHVMAILRESSAGKRLSILDVGSGSAGLAYFLHQPVIGVDIEFPPAKPSRFGSQLDCILATATSLPFEDGAFDAVVSMDTLEHLPRSHRPAAVRELFRVARELLILGFPYGETTARFDEEALREENGRGGELGWREEHVRHGVPGNELHATILSTLNEIRPGMTLTWFGQEGLLGLRLRWKLQFVISKDSRLYGAVLAPLYWMHARGRRAKAYRRIYVARSAPAFDGGGPYRTDG